MHRHNVRICWRNLTQIRVATEVRRHALQHSQQWFINKFQSCLKPLFTRKSRRPAVSRDTGHGVFHAALSNSSTGTPSQWEGTLPPPLPPPDTRYIKVLQHSGPQLAHPTGDHHGSASSYLFVLSVALMIPILGEGGGW